jgi:hypothetical protein
MRQNPHLNRHFPDTEVVGCDGAPLGGCGNEIRSQPTRVNRARYLMTNALVSRPSIAASVRHRYLAGDAHAQPTATVNPAFEGKNSVPSPPQHTSLSTQTDQNHPCGTHAPDVPAARANKRLAASRCWGKVLLGGRIRGGRECWRRTRWRRRWCNCSGWAGGQSGLPARWGTAGIR